MNLLRTMDKIEEAQKAWEVETKDLTPDEKFRKNQDIIDNMRSRGVTKYLQGTPEEIAAVERHRSASPYKVGHEPDYTLKAKRLPRKKKKILKKWMSTHRVRFTLAPRYILDKYEDKRNVRRTYYDLYYGMNHVLYGKKKELDFSSIE